MIRPESRKNTSIRAFTCTASHAAASVHIKHESEDIASGWHLNLDKDPHVGEHHTSPFCRAEISARYRHPVTVSFGDMRFGFPSESAQTSGAKIPRQNIVPIEQQHVCSLEVAPIKVRKTKNMYRGDGKVTKRYPPKTRVACEFVGHGGHHDEKNSATPPPSLQFFMSRR